jgi:hypothetical protein
MVASRWVITAGHCFQHGEASNTYVRVAGARVKSDDVAVYPGYHAGYPDIALVHLSQGVAGITTLPLATVGDRNYFNGKTVSVFGFGQTFSGSEMASVVRKSQDGAWLAPACPAELLSGDFDCFKYIGNYPNGKILAGDSGGPWVGWRNGGWRILAVVSGYFWVGPEPKFENKVWQGATSVARPEIASWIRRTMLAETLPPPAYPTIPTLPTIPASASNVRVVNADGGVYWRATTNWNSAIQRTGYGVYTNDRVSLSCWSRGGTVPPYNNNPLWYQAKIVSGQGKGSGWVNDHFLDTGTNVPNIVLPGVPQCATGPPPPPPPPPSSQSPFTATYYDSPGKALWTCSGTRTVSGAEIRDQETCTISKDTTGYAAGTFGGAPRGDIPPFVNRRWKSDYDGLTASTWSVKMTDNGDGTFTAVASAQYVTTPWILDFFVCPASDNHPTVPDQVTGAVGVACNSDYGSTVEPDRWLLCSWLVVNGNGQGPVVLRLLHNGTTLIQGAGAGYDLGNGDSYWWLSYIQDPEVPAGSYTCQILVNGAGFSERTFSVT